MISPFEITPSEDGCYQLPPGIHLATWPELAERFGTNERRRGILGGVLCALQAFKAAGCQRAFIDGSFITSKEVPGDFDGCWDHDGVDFDVLDPVLLDFYGHREAQKAKFEGELFIATTPADELETLFLDFFQLDRDARSKGIDSDRPQGYSMITNERQYQITQTQAAKFRKALAATPAEGLHPKALKALRDGAQSQLAELEEQLAEYDALRAGMVVSFTVDSITGIGEALVKARIIRNLTQKALAERMTLAEQQIQRYEATRYAGVSIERLQAVAKALKLRINEVVTLEKE